MYMFITTTEPGNPWMPDDRLHELMRERLHGHAGFAAEIRDRIPDRRMSSISRSKLFWSPRLGIAAVCC